MTATEPTASTATDTADTFLTVSQLIEILKQYPSDMRIITRGYEDGFNNGFVCGIENIKLNVNTEWYYGAHGYAEEGETSEPALLIA